jgi:hypothetical protein
MAKDKSTRTYYVYVHINKINGKRYYGITSQLPRERWKRGSPYKKQKKFYNAIQKYGWDNFEHIVLYSGLSHKEAAKIEIALIEEFHTTESAYGYNVSIGGEQSGRMYRTAEEAYAQRLENCKKSNRAKLRIVYADPELHQQLLDAKCEYHANYVHKLKQDPDAYASYLENKRIANHKRIEDPEKHEALLAWRRAYYRKQKDKLKDTKSDTLKDTKSNIA